MHRLESEHKCSESEQDCARTPFRHVACLLCARTFCLCAHNKRTSHTPCRRTHVRGVRPSQRLIHSTSRAVSAPTCDRAGHTTPPMAALLHADRTANAPSCSGLIEWSMPVGTVLLPAARASTGRSVQRLQARAAQASRHGAAHLHIRTRSTTRQDDGDEIHTHTCHIYAQIRTNRHKIRTKYAQIRTWIPDSKGYGIYGAQVVSETSSHRALEPREASPMAEHL